MSIWSGITPLQPRATRTIQSDLELGTASENNVRDALCVAFNDDLKKTPQFHPMDFAGCGCWVEVKTRPTCSSTYYPTTLLPYSKIEFAKTSDRPVYFVFVFTDGIFWVIYNEEEFSQFTVSDFRRTDRGIDKEQKYIYIPVGKLTKV